MDIAQAAHTKGGERTTTSDKAKLDFFSNRLKTRPFRLDDNFVDFYRGQQPQWGPLGYITYLRTYARTKLDGTQEEFWGTLRRVVEGCYKIQQRHCQAHHLPFNLDRAQASAQTMYRLMWQFKFLPPGRGLWMMGTDALEYIGSACLLNCAFISTEDIASDFSRPFTFLMDMSMLGVGVGSDVDGAGKVVIQQPQISGEVHTVEDSRKGWVDAYDRILKAYVGQASLPCKWDFSRVRPYGSPIRGFGGTAAGPGPLKQLVEIDIPSILQPLIGKPITAAAITDLHNFAGKCVVSGNVRRSSEIILGDIEDRDFLRLKDPEIYRTELLDRRWASNNTVKAKVGSDYTAAAASTAKNGEPGYIWLENARKFGRFVDPPDYADQRIRGVNPCGEQMLESEEACNLVETFPANHSSYNDYERTLKFAYLYAKTVTLVPSHDEGSNAIMMRNRRIGLSQSGIAQSIGKIGRRRHFEWCDTGYRYVTALDKQYSDWLCIPRSVRRTTTKPSGTISLLCGATPGIHFPHSQFYIRRVRIAEGSPLLAALQRSGYRTEKDIYAPNTFCVEIPVQEANFVKAEKDLSIWEQSLNAVMMSRFWSDNSTSVTVKFNRETEGKDIYNVLETFEDQLKTISFLPYEHGYAQAPYEQITSEEYHTRFNRLGRLAVSTNAFEQAERFCDGDRCSIQK